MEKSTEAVNVPKVYSSFTEYKKYRTEKKLRKKLLLEQKAQEDKREQNLENSLNKEELQEIEFAKLIINQTNKTLPKPIKLDSLFSALTENWNVEKSELEKEELFFEDIHEDN